MFSFGEKHPVLFEVILVIVAFVVAGILTAVGSLVGMHPDLSSSLARIAVGLVLLVVFRRAFVGGQPLSNLAIVLPALGFAVWNLFYNLSSGALLGGPSILVEACITALAPAIFEEVLFRGVFIYNLRAKGFVDLACLLVSAVLFSAIHLTNLAGLDVVSVALQVGYSLVIGMVLAAIYIKNGSILQVMAVHFLIDFTNRIYVQQPSTASVPQLVIFALLLVVEAAYAVWLIRSQR